MIVDLNSRKLLATAFAPGRDHDFALLRASGVILAPETLCLADSGYQGLQKCHEKSRTPRKKSRHRPLTPEEKADNRDLARRRIAIEHVIRRLKVFKILSDRYRNRRKRFGLRFNLIAALYNLEYSS